MKKPVLLYLILPLFIIFNGCSDKEQTVTTPSGLQYIDEIVGTGPSPEKGQQVTVHYTGFLQDGTKFASSRTKSALKILQSV
jgi:peptidylprolyl isomerase